MGRKTRTRKEIAAPAPRRLVPWVERRAAAFFWVLLAIASLRIVSTYGVFNHTIDEPAHVACGMEWLDRGVYRYEPQHPPLARVAAALGPYLMGRRVLGVSDMYKEGAWDLYGDNHYDRNLALARLGILPFFWIACAVVFLWARRVYGRFSAVIAVFLFTFLPPILAHAGLATTDMALTAFVGAGFFAGLRFMEAPSLARALVLGVCLGFAALSKFSAAPFLVCAAFASLAVWALVAKPPLSGTWTSALQRFPGFALAAFVACFMIWAGYRFSFGAVPILHLRLPAPELFQGIHDVLDHNRQGHPAYLLGMYSMFGWWYYYIVVLFFKSPLPFLIFVAVGIGIIFRQRGALRVDVLYPLTFSGAILLFCFLSNINIGVRHILPVYLGLSVTAAAGLTRMLDSQGRATWERWTATVLVVWLAGSSLLSHPDYIPYFNEFAGSEPEKILVDSDLDWGQDMKRLGKRLQELGAREVTFNPFIVAYLERVHGFPPIQPMDPVSPSPGWNAASLTVVKVGWEKERLEGMHVWTDQIKPTERVGKTTLLWYFPPSALPAR